MGSLPSFGCRAKDEASSFVGQTEQVIGGDAIELGELDHGPNRYVINAFFIAPVYFALHMQ